MKSFTPKILIHIFVVFDILALASSLYLSVFGQQATSRLPMLFAVQVLFFWLPG